jgi:hypothetical protein
MFHILIYKGNSNQNQIYIEIPSHPSQNNYHHEKLRKQEQKQNTNAGEDAEGISHTVSRNEN